MNLVDLYAIKVEMKLPPSCHNKALRAGNMRYSKYKSDRHYEWILNPPSCKGGCRTADGCIEVSLNMQGDYDKCLHQYTVGVLTL